MRDYDKAIVNLSIPEIQTTQAIFHGKMSPVERAEVREYSHRRGSS